MTTQGAAEQLGFLDTLVTIRVGFAEGEDRMSVIESVARRGDSPPLHVHERQDEAFYVLDGELRVHVADEDVRLGPGEGALAPKGAPHTYRVESETARWLAVTVGEDFETFVRELGRPAERTTLPEPSGPPTPEQAEALEATAREHGIELVGPPLV